MKARRKLGLLFCMAILIAAFGSSAKADEFDKLAIFTFSAPVELPGGIVLPAGTYVFKLSNRNVVQIFDREQPGVFATIFTVSAERLRPSDMAVVELSQTGADAPYALRTWFYSGDSYGQEFVYPRAREAELSKTAKQSVTVISANLTSSQVRP